MKTTEDIFNKSFSHAFDTTSNFESAFRDVSSKVALQYATYILDYVSESLEGVDSFDPITESREVIKSIKRQLK